MSENKNPTVPANRYDKAVKEMGGEHEAIGRHVDAEIAATHYVLAKVRKMHDKANQRYYNVVHRITMAKELYDKQLPVNQGGKIVNRKNGELLPDSTGCKYFVVHDPNQAVKVDNKPEDKGNKDGGPGDTSAPGK